MVLAPTGPRLAVLERVVDVGAHLEREVRGWSDGEGLDVEIGAVLTIYVVALLRCSVLYKHRAFYIDNMVISTVLLMLGIICEILLLISYAIMIYS